MQTGLSVVFLLVTGIILQAQEFSKYIVVDQFGYLPESRKVAVIRDPQVGFDATESFSPGNNYALVDARTGEKVFRADISIWGGGKTDESSGDRAWHFDFSEVMETGTYYVLDEERNVRSYEFVIAHNVYNEVLRQAMRTFFYQRAGFRKEAQYAGVAWADEASHVGDLQDNNCRSFFDKLNPGSEKDISGGWYDAGDYNKYTNWTANYVVELMKAYLEKPEAWGDDYNIPESGNGMPDILDEAIWGIDHLLRMQNEDGSVLSIVGEDHASPPSAATGPSYYGPPNTSSALNTSAAFAIGSRVYREQGLTAYADTLLARALKAWEWAELYPDSLFNNNDPAYESITLGAGTQEVNEYGRFMARMEAACYLFGETGNTEFRDFFDDNYQDVHMFQWTFTYPYEALNQEIMLYYTTLPEGTGSVQDHIKNVYRTTVVTSDRNMAAYTGNKDPYLAYTHSYVWGSNGVKSSQGSMNYNLITYGMDDGIESLARESAEVYIHNLHGVNPLNFVYLSNMYDYGAENGVKEFYHSWFSNGSPTWDRVGTSVHGPAPGYLTGGPNPGYDWDGCCPGGCGSSSNNQKCTAESISPPKGQPAQKSYKDFNTSWPLNSWSVTENSCGYQVRYIRLLSKFVTAGMDCNGDVDGGAFMDSCGICAGGNTGIEPSLDPVLCEDSVAVRETMYVEGRHLYTAAGEKVVLRGVNEMFVWSDDRRGLRLIPEIARTGANCVRLVWDTETGFEYTLVDLIERCIDHKMIAMPECHSATGDWSKLDVCINFWNHPGLREGIQRNRKWTLLNIGNEVGDGSVSAQQFKTGYMKAIDSLRAWGYTVPLVIDASTWGQNINVIFSTWKELLEHDPLHNILFSVHSYWSDINNYNRVASEAINEGLPVIIGEGPSPTAYPVCEILDYGTGLNVTALNEIGWLSWSWGGVANGHCIPNFDHTEEGVFGKWRTPYAEDMMVGHQFSLMRTARRPSSFFTNDSVPAAGIYFSPVLTTMTVGDTVTLEAIVTPVNAVHREFRFELSGDTDAVDLGPEGMLAARSAGIIRITVISEENPELSFSREIQVRDIPVSSISISPSEAEILVGDTLFFDVEVLPENATVKEFILEIVDTASVIEVDTIRRMVTGTAEGGAQILARWVNGDINGTLDISVSKDVTGAAQGIVPEFKIYPNPSDGVLYVECNQQSPVELSILDPGGKILLNKEYRGSTKIETGHLSPGIYMVVHEGNDLIIRQQLVIL